MVSNRQFEQANRRAKAQLRTFPPATNVQYDRSSKKIVVRLSTGIEVSFLAASAQGLEGAKPSQLKQVEITPSGLGLHFPQLDVDIYIPGLLQGFFGSTKWIAAQLGASGGRSKSPAKASAARANGRLGGRPKKIVAA